MKKPLPTIDEMFSAFFGQQIDDSNGVQRRRIERVDDLLREYLEAEAEAFLTLPEQALLGAEREFGTVGAVCRTMRADALLFALPGFIRPPFLQTDPLLQRVQLRMVEALAARLVWNDLAGFDTSCVQYQLEFALNHAKRELNRERREKARARRDAQREAAMRDLAERMPDVFGPRTPWRQRESS